MYVKHITISKQVYMTKYDVTQYSIALHEEQIEYDRKMMTWDKE